MKPLIGISTCVSFANDPNRSFNKSTEIQYIQRHYIDMVRNVGGIPVLIPILEDPEEISALAERLDGVIFTGGPDDVNPALYNEENIASHDVNETRDSSEISLLREMRRNKKAILGVCRGHQIVNVAFGGSNYQDIPSQIAEALPHPLDANKQEVFHQVQFPCPSFLTELFSEEEIRTNSSHHQSVKVPGDGLTVIAKAPDGVVEAVQCFDDYCTIGIQWHPERMQKDPKMVALIRWFMDKAAKK